VHLKRVFKNLVQKLKSYENYSIGLIMYNYHRFPIAYMAKLTQSFTQLKNNKERGFTLLELLITVLIVGIMSVISIPAYVATVDKFHYAEAKIQMGCLKRELEGYRIEKGYFPTDQYPNITPVGIECFFKQDTSLVPYNSQYDYENWSATGGCLIQITFFGKNKIREAPVSSLYSQPGFHDHKTNNADDLVLSLGIQPKQVCQP
jgi:prepilin-type N-terminal cleavage/methylation domain-containing protein